LDDDDRGGGKVVSISGVGGGVGRDDLGSGGLCLGVERSGWGEILLFGSERCGCEM